MGLQDFTIRSTLYRVLRVLDAQRLRDAHVQRDTAATRVSGGMRTNITLIAKI
jgi:hypothetical protein